METKIWTEYHDWLTWQKKHKHLNLTIEQAFNSYKKELLLWEEVERVRVLNERILRDYYGGQTTSAGGGGSSPQSLEAALDVRFAAVDLFGIYAGGDPITTWDEHNNKETLTVGGSGTITADSISIDPPKPKGVIVAGDGAYLQALNSTVPELNPFTAARKQTLFWLGNVSDTTPVNETYSLFACRESGGSKFVFSIRGDISGTPLISVNTTYVTSAGQTNVNISNAPIHAGYDPTTGPTLAILKLDVLEQGIYQAIISDEVDSTTANGTITNLGVPQSSNPVNFFLSIEDNSGSPAQAPNQNVFEYRAYNRILSDSEINQVINELNGLYGVSIVNL